VATDRSTIEPGKRADLLLLTADPLEDVANTRRIAAVILGGRYLGRTELDAMLAALPCPCFPSSAREPEG
jgi:cytosine/adenosine deaminase-related metal-dependent hydrolase